MTIPLPPHVEALLQEKVAGGRCATTGEGIAAAVRLLDEHDRRLERLRAAIAEGEAGEAMPWTPEPMERWSREAEELTRQGIPPHADVCP